MNVIGNNPLSREADVNIQSQTNTFFQYFLQEELQTNITLASAIDADDEVISLNTGHGFVNGVAGQYLTVRNGDLFQQFEVKSVSGDDVTLFIPSDKPYPITSKVVRGNVYFNVDGSSTDRIFEFSFFGDTNAFIPIDVENIIITMLSAGVPDDGKFGGITALTEPCYFRKVNGDISNLGVFKNNQDFADRGGLVTYPDKAPSGTYSTRIIFELDKLFDAIQRFDPRESDSLRFIVPANLSTLGVSKISLIGSYTIGE